VSAAHRSLSDIHIFETHNARKPTYFCHQASGESNNAIDLAQLCLSYQAKSG